jgi:hypothetical protein
VALSIDACFFLVPSPFNSTLTLILLGGSDPLDFKALSDYCVFLGSYLIAWKNKKKIVVSHTSVEAELHALSFVTAKVTWL